MRSAATGKSSVWYVSTIASIQWLRMSMSVSSESLRRAVVVVSMFGEML